MTDGYEPWERRLSRLRPRELSPALVSRIETELEAPVPAPRSDRVLWCAITSGAMAACVIAGVLLRQPASASSAPPAMVRDGVPRLGSFAESIARADAGSDDFMR